MVRPRIFFDFSVDNSAIGRVIFELYTDSAPKTCENFRALCTGEKGISSSGNPLYYKNSIIHRSIKDFMIQGGDFTKRNGSGGESIYDGQFPDEDLTRPLDSEGLLCMANRGSNTNGSQFFITLRECPHLNGKHVVFGEIIRGYEVIQRVGEVPVDEKDRPMVPVVISNCGELELRKKQSAQVKPSRSVSNEEQLEYRHRRKRSSSRDSDRKERHSKKTKHKKNPDRDLKISDRGVSDKPIEETEEEYDARLEREEIERLEAERKKEFERIKIQYTKETTSKDGVRFKGRGRMKFVDPEVNQR